MKKKIFAPGSLAMVGIYTARVVTVTLREGFVGYQASWWVGAERRFDNLAESEVTAVAESQFMFLECDNAPSSPTPKKP